MCAADPFKMTDPNAHSRASGGVAKPTILIALRDLFLAITTKEILQARGFAVVIVHNSNDAVSYIKTSLNQPRTQQTLRGIVLSETIGNPPGSEVLEALSDLGSYLPVVLLAPPSHTPQLKGSWQRQPLNTSHHFALRYLVEWPFVAEEIVIGLFRCMGIYNELDALDAHNLAVVEHQTKHLSAVSNDPRKRVLIVEDDWEQIDTLMDSLSSRNFLCNGANRELGPAFYDRYLI